MLGGKTELFSTASCNIYCIIIVAIGHMAF